MLTTQERLNKQMFEKIKIISRALGEADKWKDTQAEVRYLKMEIDDFIEQIENYHDGVKKGIILSDLEERFGK